MPASLRPLIILSNNYIIKYNAVRRPRRVETRIRAGWTLHDSIQQCMHTLAYAVRMRNLRTKHTDAQTITHESRKLYICTKQSLFTYGIFCKIYKSRQNSWMWKITELVGNFCGLFPGSFFAFLNSNFEWKFLIFENSRRVMFFFFYFASSGFGLASWNWQIKIFFITNSDSVMQKRWKFLRLSTLLSHYMHIYWVGKVEERRRWLRISELTIFFFYFSWRITICYLQ